MTAGLEPVALLAMSVSVSMWVALTLIVGVALNRSDKRRKP